MSTHNIITFHLFSWTNMKNIYLIFSLIRAMHKSGGTEVSTSYVAPSLLTVIQREVCICVVNISYIFEQLGCFCVFIVQLACWTGRVSAL